MENVVFRKEKRKINGYVSYLALFYDDAASPGFVACLPFHFVELDTIFESHSEASFGYIYGDTRIVHKNDTMIPKLVNAVERYRKTKLCVREKMVKRR